MVTSARFCSTGLPSLNAVNQPLHRALANVWRQIAADPEARVVVLHRDGTRFLRRGRSRLDNLFPRRFRRGEGRVLREGAGDY